ncbi:Uma2 family endonuclease [bacterium]|nr:Uma2 family endonuclease [bacterium]
MQEVLARDGLFEVIGGEVVEIERMDAAETKLASLLIRLIGQFTDADDAGHVVMETMFDLHLPSGRQRRPDLAFVSCERWPLDKPLPRGEAWDVIPDLAIEVVSPSNRADEIMTKVIEYFGAGVRSVWVVFPGQHTIQVYSSPTELRGFVDSDELSGDPVLPGFRLPLEKLFRNFPKSDPPPSDRPLD